jgi:hypothetical protein
MNAREEFIHNLHAQGYQMVRELPNVGYIGVMPMLFTFGLFVGLDSRSYVRRYCYKHFHEAAHALGTWDGIGDPPGPWIKEKMSVRLGPGATE